jgi:hypothetical protein
MSTTIVWDDVEPEDKNVEDLCACKNYGCGRAFSASISHNSFRDKSESHFSLQDINLMKYSLSSGVNLLPRLLGTTFVGGEGDLDGGFGI